MHHAITLKLSSEENLRFLCHQSYKQHLLKQFLLLRSVLFLSCTRESTDLNHRIASIASFQGLHLQWQKATRQLPNVKMEQELH